MDKMKVTYEAMLSLTAEMVLDDALRKYRTEQIYQEIDKALATGDRISFRLLTDELKSMN